MPSAEEKAEQEFRDQCEHIASNDPSFAFLNLDDYKMLDWEHARELAAALDKNTHVREMMLTLQKDYITRDGHTPLLYFLRTTSSLRKVSVFAWGEETPGQDFGATNVLEAVSHNKSVVSLHVNGMVYRQPDILSHMLTSSQTLTEFNFKWGNGRGNSSEVAQALRRGLQQNTHLKTVDLQLGCGPQVVPDVLSGLLSLRSLRKLTLAFHVTEASAEALRFFLLGNDTLETLSLSISCPIEEASSAMTALLLGLATNRGLKTFLLRGTIVTGEQTRVCANAWTEMLAKNSTLEIFDVADNTIGGSSGGTCFGRECTSAIARGISKNSSLLTLRLSNLLQAGALRGPVWHDALEKNNTLRKLVLAGCEVGTCSDFASFAQGLACNKSLKALKLWNNNIVNSQALELVNALQTNGVLESLDLFMNAIEGPDAAGVVHGLWSKKNLLHLDLYSNKFGGGDDSTTVFSEGLPKNGTLQTLNIGECNMNSSDFCIVINSLCESNALQTLQVGSNSNIFVDGPAATALKELLLSSSLEELFISETMFTRAGMVEVAAGLLGNTRLSKLCVAGHSSEMDYETLAPLCEALQVNSTLSSLSIDGTLLDSAGVRGFFGLLPRMKGIETLAIHFDLEDLDTACEKAVLDGFRRNTSLKSLSNVDDCELPDHLRKSIAFYLKMNRNGRKYLQEDDKAKDKTETENGDNSNNVRADMPHIGAWPRILAKMTSPSEQDQLFYFLRRKTDLFQGPAPTRKRKASDSAS